MHLLQMLLYKPGPRAARRLRLSMALVLLLILIVPILGQRSAEAHAVLEKSEPVADSQLAEAPEHIALTFNERLETSLYLLVVLDRTGKPVTDREPVISEDRRQISLELPRLAADNLYTVAYRVISADGHPVSGSYVFTIGDPPPAKDASMFDVHKQLGHSDHSHHHHHSQLGTAEFLLYVSRMVFFAALLAVSGWMLWSALLPHNQTLADVFRGGGTPLLRFYLLALIALIMTHGYDLLEDITSLAEWKQLLTMTSVGQFWLVSLGLSAIGFAAALRNRWIGGVWGLVLLAAKSMSGHAAAYDPKLYTVLLDFVHLVAAAVWGGGLLLLWILYRKHREELDRFVPVFSNAALVSIVVMIGTGLLTVFAFLPDLNYLFMTVWGTFLLVKTAFVLIVLLIGFLLRRRIRNRSFADSRALLRADLTMAILIVSVVGLLTYFSPLPSNEPFHWHRMGEDMHLTVRISPNTTGENQFIVKVWLPEELGEPKRTVLRLKPLNREDVAPIDVPIEPYADPEPDMSFDGFKKYTYRGEGAYIPFPGRWEVEARVLDSEDTEIVDKKSMRIY